MDFTINEGFGFQQYIIQVALLIYSIFCLKVSKDKNGRPGNISFSMKVSVNFVNITLIAM